MAHQLPTVEEADGHQGVTWEGMGRYTTHQQKTNTAWSSLQHPKPTRTVKYPGSKPHLMEETSYLLEDISSNTEHGSSTDQARPPIPNSFLLPLLHLEADLNIPGPQSQATRQDVSLLSMQTPWMFSRVQYLPNPKQSLSQGGEPPSVTTHEAEPQSGF